MAEGESRTEKRMRHAFQGIYPRKCYVLVEGYDGDFDPPYHVCQTLETAKVWLIGEAKSWAIQEADGKDNIVSDSIKWTQLDKDEIALHYTATVKRRVLKPNHISQSESGLFAVSDGHYEDTTENISPNILTILIVDFGDEQLT